MWRHDRSLSRFGGKTTGLAELPRVVQEVLRRGAFVATSQPIPAKTDREHFHGAVTRVGVTDTPVPHREAGHSVLITSVWTDPGGTDENVAWTQTTFEAMRPFFVDRRWLNYFSDDDRGDATRAAYGLNYERLAQVKRTYDPENIFHLNHNIEPG